ncbi:MAG: hypothetical protein WBF24_00300 [Xanthobacteraceae bacterium]
MTVPAVKSASTVTVHVPMTFAIRGGRKTIISEEIYGAHERVHASNEAAHAEHELVHRPRQRTDNALLKALARGHRWRCKIESGEYASITDLAEAEQVNQSYACRLLRLTLLAPAVVIDILDGRQTPDLMLKRLMKPLPLRWDEQLAELRLVR